MLTNSKFQVGIDPTQRIIWNDEFSVIDYFKSYQLYLNFYYANIFAETNTLPLEVKKSFYRRHLHNDYFNVNEMFVKIKFLSDTFSMSDPKTVFCLREAPHYVITKGIKKFYAFALCNKFNAYTISVTKEPTLYTVNNDNELYSNLKSIDLDTDVYRLNLGWEEDLPNIQYLENVDTIYKWCNVNDEIVAAFTSFVTNPIKVFVEGNNCSVDSRLEITNKHDAHCIVTCSQPCSISYEDIAFNSYNFRTQEKTTSFATDCFSVVYL